MSEEKITSVVRALKILECFMDFSKEWTTKSLSSYLGLPTTTVYRQLSTLTELGYLQQDPLRKSYAIGHKLLLLSSVISNHSDLHSIAYPEMKKLSAIVKETINLTILVDNEVFYVNKVETFRTVVCNTKIGSKAHAHASSGGKVILSDQSDEFIDNYCALLPTLEPLTPYTNSSPERLRQELAQVREQGYAVDIGEVEAELICIAAPIRDNSKRIIAAISIAGPSFRMEKDMDFMISEVKKAGANISELLGYRPDLP